MDGFGTLLLLVLIILVVVLIRKINAVDQKINFLNDEFKHGFKSLLRRVGEQHTETTKKEPVVKPTPPKVEKPPIIVPPTPVVPPVSNTQKPKTTSEPKITPIYEGQKTQPVRVANQVVKPVDAEKKRGPLPPPPPPRPTFMERNPDLEKFIGENLLSKIGIVIFVIGMGFLVKLGIDNGVITEGMRVAIGVLIGSVMVGLAFYLRKAFATFSSILIGGALAVLYFTIAMAFHEYNIISQTAAFIIMIGITGFGVLLSIAFDRKELAVLAIIGGFGTPFFISTGSGNVKVLLTYILILDIGMLALVYFKKWNIINYLAYGFTYILFAGVFFSKFMGHEDVLRIPMFLFLTAFYLIFFLMTVIYNVKNNHKFKFAEIGILLSNSGIYFGLGLAIVSGYKDGIYNGLFTTLIAIFNLAFTTILYKRKNIDKNLLFLLIGLVLTFVSLIAPIQLHGNYITLFWAIESVLLLWLSQKSGIQLMKTAFTLVAVLMIGSLLMDWQMYYNTQVETLSLPLFINRVFITTLVVISSLFGIRKLLLNEPSDSEFTGIPKSFVSKAIPLLLVAVLFVGLMLELNYQFIRADFTYTLRTIAMGCYYFGFLIAVILFSKWKKQTETLSFLNAVSLLLIASYLTFYLVQISTARNLYLTGQSGASTGYYLHYALFSLFVLLVINTAKEAYFQYGYKSVIGRNSLWILAFVGVFVASAEIGHLAVIYQYSPSVSLNDTFSNIFKSVYPIVWGVSALVLMILGMKFKLKTLRIISLSLFLITIVKLFIYDLKGNSTGKIVSFIFLGVVLLLISFLYQKLKFIIQNDEEENNN